MSETNFPDIYCERLDMNITWSTYFIDEAAKNERSLSRGYEKYLCNKKMYLYVEYDIQF